MINHSLTLLPFFPFQLSSSAEKFLPLWMLDVFSHVGRKINMKCPMIHLDFHSWQHLWKLTFVLLSVQKLSPGRKQVHISQSSTTFSIRDSCSVAAEIFVFVSRGWEKKMAMLSTVKDQRFLAPRASKTIEAKAVYFWQTQLFNLVLRVTKPQEFTLCLLWFRYILFYEVGHCQGSNFAGPSNLKNHFKAKVFYFRKTQLF